MGYKQNAYCVNLSHVCMFGVAQSAVKSVGYAFDLQDGACGMLSMYCVSSTVSLRTPNSSSTLI